MGTVYDRNKSDPARGPNIWIKFRGPEGGWQYRAIGHVNPAEFTKAQVKDKTKELRRLGADVLTRIEADILGGRYELIDRTKPKPREPTFTEVAEPWAKKRRTSHRAGRHDVGRMQNHLIPFFGKHTVRHISENPGLVKAYIESKQGVISGGTIKRTLALLSRFYNDQIEGGAKLRNPVLALDKTTRRRVRSTHDPRKTPFLRTKDEIRKVYLALPEAKKVNQPYRVMFAVGVFAGLRPGEIIALDWERDINLKARRIHVQWQVKESQLALLKDTESRVVPILDTLLPVLREWRMVTGGKGLCFPPVAGRGGRPDHPAQFRRLHTIGKQLKKALKECMLPTTLTWYQSTRHTFASHWVMDGRTLEKLREILGHSSVKVTERYAHLLPDMYCQADYEVINVDLSEPRVFRLEDADRVTHMLHRASGDEKTQ